MRDRILSGLVAACLFGSCAPSGPEAERSTLERRAEEYETHLIGEFGEGRIDPLLSGSYWLNTEALGDALDGNTLDLRKLAQEKNVVLYFQQIWCSLRLRGTFQSLEHVYREDEDFLPIAVYPDGTPEGYRGADERYSTNPELLREMYERLDVNVPAVIAGPLWNDHGSLENPRIYFISLLPPGAPASLDDAQDSTLERMRYLTLEDPGYRIREWNTHSSAIGARGAELSCPKIFEGLPD